MDYRAVQPSAQELTKADSGENEQYHADRGAKEQKPDYFLTVHAAKI
jgi:hypothetical protein